MCSQSELLLFDPLSSFFLLSSRRFSASLLASFSPTGVAPLDRSSASAFSSLNRLRSLTSFAISSRCFRSSSSSISFSSLANLFSSAFLFAFSTLLSSAFPPLSPLLDNLLPSGPNPSLSPDDVNLNILLDNHLIVTQKDENKRHENPKKELSPGQRRSGQYAESQS
uniref:Uncharacterized protein n=1 Tax=Arundo donax TaxID=35708 RepID=A0A0A9CYN6_ARUDO